jgi:SAM-dependent methyltransferase
MMRLAKIFRRNRWEWLIALRLNNLRVNRCIQPVALESLKTLNVQLGRLELTSEDYRRFVAAPAIRSYAGLPYAHSKVIEYLTTATLLNLRSGCRLLDAAGGSNAEYLRTVAAHTRGLYGVIQDPFASEELKSQFTVLHGLIEQIPIEDESLDAISCHHSLEHFQGDLDGRFIEEAVRVLRPGGRLAIAPIFITTCYAEIWNRGAPNGGDPAARKIVDRTATFAGWGPYEGFARTYDKETFRNRILARIPSRCDVTIYEVLLDGRPAPDLKANRHQPLLNGRMKALLVEK